MWRQNDQSTLTRLAGSGIAAHLLGQDAHALGEPGGAAGPVLENVVAMEPARQLTWSDVRGRRHHHRTKDQVEVKAGATVHSADLAGLRHLEQQLGDRFVAGYVRYTGQQTLPFGPRLRALPIDALWRPAP